MEQLQVLMEDKPLVQAENPLIQAEEESQVQTKDKPQVQAKMKPIIQAKEKPIVQAKNSPLVQSDEEIHVVENVNCVGGTISNEESMKTKILNFFSRLRMAFTTSIPLNKIAIARIICFIWSIVDIIYISKFVDDSLKSKFLNVMAVSIILFMQIVFGGFIKMSEVFRNKDFKILLALIYTSVIAKLMDIKQKVPEDLMKNEIYCFVFFFIQCVIFSVIVAIYDLNETKNRLSTLANVEVYENNETKKNRKRIIKIHKIHTEKDEPTSQQLNLSPMESDVSGEVNPMISFNFTGEDMSMFEYKNLFRNESAVRAENKWCKTFVTTADVHDVEENSLPRFREKIGEVSSLQEERESQSIQINEKLNSAHYSKSKGVRRNDPISKVNESEILITSKKYNYDLSKIEELTSKILGSNDTQQSITMDFSLYSPKTMVSPSTGARSKDPARKLYNYDKSMSKAFTSLESEDSELSTFYVSNNVESFIYGTYNFPNSDMENKSCEKLSIGDSSRKPVLMRPYSLLDPEILSPPRNEGEISRRNLICSPPKKLVFRYPLEQHLPSFFDVDHNIPEKLFKNLKEKPDSISSVRIIAIFECFGDKRIMVSKTKTKDEVFYVT